jgi:hypothetical protein
MHAAFAVHVNQLVGTCSHEVHSVFLLWSITWSVSVLTVQRSNSSEAMLFVGDKQACALVLAVPCPNQLADCSNGFFGKPSVFRVCLSQF